MIILIFLMINLIIQVAIYYLQPSSKMLSLSLSFHNTCEHLWNTSNTKRDICKRIREVVKKTQIFYGQADRKGGGGQPPLAWP